MTQCEGLARFTVQNVFDCLCDYPGTWFLLEDICVQTGYTPPQAQLALDTLAQQGMIAQERTVGGRVAYGYHRADPRRLRWEEPPRAVALEG